MSPATIADQETTQASIRMATLFALGVAPIDPETARDVQIKLKLASEARKQGMPGEAAYWLGKATASMEEYKRFRTDDWTRPHADCGATKSESTMDSTVTLPTTAMRQAGF